MSASVVYIANDHGGIVREPASRWEGGWWKAAHRRPSHCRDAREEGLWWVILRTCNWRDGHIPDTLEPLPRGSCFQNVSKLGDEFGYTRKQMRLILQRWVEAGAIKFYTPFPRKRPQGGHNGATTGPGLHPMGTVISVLNYAAYQDTSEGQGPQAGHKGATRGPLSKDSRWKMEEEETRTNSEHTQPTQESDSAAPRADARCESDLFRHQASEPPTAAMRKSQRKADGMTPQEKNEFEEFWAAWIIPNTKRGLEPAREAFVKARRAGAEFKQILSALKAYMALCRAEAREIRFIAHPATWLNQKRWLDEIHQPPDNNGAAYSPKPRQTEHCGSPGWDGIL